MLGQLDWDGVVLPINDVKWENVLATAKRLQGLELDEDFYVTYKDEEGDVINVKNEADLVEAVRWAQDQGIPCLCMHIPFAAPDSDSDESWTELDDGTPRATKYVPDQVVESEMQPEDLMRESVEDEHQQETVHLEDEEKPESRVETPIQVSTPLPEPVVEVQEPPFEKEVEEDAGVETCEEESVEEAQEIAPEATREVAPFEEVEEVASQEEDEEPVPVLEFNPNLDRFVEMLCSINDATPSSDSVIEKSKLLDLFSNAENVKVLASILKEPLVQNAVVAIAQAERSQSGLGLKVGTTQLLKLVSMNPAFVDMVHRVPGLDALLGDVLRQMKPVQKQVHDQIVCDGCDSNDELLNASKLNGTRAANGEISGIRYKSATLPNFDLCESCEASGRFQAKAGPFLKIIDPASAPEIILCALPGAATGMMSQIDSLDWRNPLAKEFLEFVQSRQQRAFPQQRSAQKVEVQAEKTPEVEPVQVQEPVSVEPVVPPFTVSAPATIFSAPVVAQPTLDRSQLRCQHLLKSFETSHSGFTCDVCFVKQPTRSLMHGCRPCNFDVCQNCHSRLALPLPVTPVAAPPQAKFVSDVTLADGCVVRPGELLNKSWRVRNSGSDKWPKGTRIAHVGGDSFGGPLNGVEVPLAAPGEAVNVTVPLVMPQQPGRYTSYWRMMTPHPTNAKFGHRFWVTVNVVPAPLPPPVIGQLHTRELDTPGAIIRPPPPTVRQTDQYLAGSPQPVASAPARPPPPPPPVHEEPIIAPEYEMAVAQITEFGFSDIDKIVKILKEVNGDTSAAIDKLLEEN